MRVMHFGSETPTEIQLKVKFESETPTEIQLKVKFELPTYQCDCYFLLVL